MKSSRSERAGGFTLVELLVVMAIISLLASLLLASLRHSKGKAMTIQAVSNLKQLEMAWRLYSVDNDLKILAAGRTPEAPDWTAGQWLNLPINEEAEINPFAEEKGIVNSPLWEYAGEQPSIWRDPRDRSMGSLPYYNDGELAPRVRSFSVNCWVGGPAWSPSGPGWRVFRSTSDMAPIGPANVFVFLSERPDSINDGWFIVDMAGYPTYAGTANPQATLVEYPANYFKDTGTFTFADGHAELVPWRDVRTKPPLRLDRNLELNLASPNNPDVLWLQRHATFRDQVVEDPSK